MVLPVPPLATTSSHNDCTPSHFSTQIWEKKSLWISCERKEKEFLFTKGENVLSFPTEGWLSGRKHRTANAAEGQTSQGFESLTFREYKNRTQRVLFFTYE